MRIKVKAASVGALVTLFLWAMIFLALNSVYRGNPPWLVAGLAALLCPVLGGYMATRLGQTESMRLGAMAGLAAGLLVLLLAAVVSRLAPNTILAGIVLSVVAAAGGGMGTWLRYRVAGAMIVLMMCIPILLSMSACAPTMTGTGDALTPLVAEDGSFNLVELAGLGTSVMIEVMAFDLDRSGNEMDPYIRRLTITETQTLDLLVDALDTDLQLALKVECIPEYRLFFHLQDGSVHEFGYSCGGASFIRGDQDFWEEQDYHPTERFDTLIEEQLALNPLEPLEVSINVVEEVGLALAVELEISQVRISRSSEDGISEESVSIEHLMHVSDARTLQALVTSLDLARDLVPRTLCVPEYQLRFKLSDGALYDLSYGCELEGAPVMRGNQQFWHGMDLVAPAEFNALFEEQGGS